VVTAGTRSQSAGFADGSVFWLEEIRDGLVWRVRAFTARDEAMQAYEEVVASGS
jgi:hypothetical protein